MYSTTFEIASKPETRTKLKMGKKKKSTRSGAVGPTRKLNEEEAVITARYNQDETFADSQDEFFAGKDQVMLEEGPSRKRRKQIEEQGEWLK